jgi:NitT/TauT family transport system substrate-binding protein
VKLQLQWFTQAQFAGYYAAQDQGFYTEQCLEVTILEGAVDISPQTVLANGEADFAISWVSKALASREGGADIVNIAQVFQRSGTLQVSFKDKNITKSADFKGKNIGNWGYGNEFEIFAALTAAGLDPAKDVKLVQQQFDMAGLLAGDIDAAEAMTYNEYAQVLEAVNPKTKALYTAEDFNVVSQILHMSTQRQSLLLLHFKVGHSAATTHRHAVTLLCQRDPSLVQVTSCGR